jgi:hypothetical protein
MKFTMRIERTLYQYLPDVIDLLYVEVNLDNQVKVLTLLI